MGPFVALLLGIVEGLTEFLPVSSTGHLILVDRLLGVEGASSFEIVIQLGAVLAIVVHYRALLWRHLRGAFAGSREAWQLVGAVVIGFLPTAVVGALLHKAIKAHLFGPGPVAAALVAGGLLMIAVERWRAHKKVEGLDGLEHVTWKRALAIGAGQCVAMWPGSSRSMCTIVTGQLTGLSTATAAEFSFLLSLPTLGAATLFEAYKGRHELATTVGVTSLVVGLLVSFLVAWGVIAGFLRYLKQRGLEPFGYYRIAVGLLIFTLVLRGGL